MTLRSLALGAARSGAGGRLVATLAHRFPRTVPSRIAIRDSLIVLRHPVPMTDGHLLAISRHGILDAAQDHAGADRFWTELADWVLTHGPEHAIESGLTNLGARQDVRLLHVHLLPEVPGWATGAPRAEGDRLGDVLRDLRADASLDLGRHTASIATRVAGQGWSAHVDLAD